MNEEYVERAITLGHDKMVLEAKVKSLEIRLEDLAKRYDALNERYWTLQDRHQKVQETLLNTLYAQGQSP
jgi:chaperonin cofactor prefoldin